MGRMLRRYPLQPLLDMAGLNASHSVKALGLGGPEYRKYRSEGMAREVAERKALRVGLHPYEVWPDMVEHDLPSLECEADDCTERFDIPPFGRGGKGKRFCSETCRSRMKNRRRRQDDAVRAQDRARQRAYDAYLRERRRERELRNPVRRLRLLDRLEAEQIPAADRHLRAS